MAHTAAARTEDSARRAVCSDRTVSIFDPFGVYAELGAADDKPLLEPAGFDRQDTVWGAACNTVPGTDGSSNAGGGALHGSDSAADSTDTTALAFLE